MPERFIKQIVGHVGRKGYQPVKVRQLARALGVRDKDYGAFRAAVRRLQADGRIMEGAGKTLLAPSAGNRVVGVYRANPRGFGFIVPEEPGTHGDVFVPAGMQMDAVTGDTVSGVVGTRRRGEERVSYARVTEILHRGRNRFVGTVHRRESLWFVEADGTCLHEPILVPDAPSQRVREGEKVVVELTDRPSAEQSARGAIVEVLGPAGKPGVDVLSIIREFDLPETFESGVSDEARSVTDSYDPAAMSKREDLQNLLTFTIDPDDARDFDDAISIERTPDGWTLGVHIADVSHFVRDGSVLDAEARLRGTSVYFPRHVIPMLPESLSNGVCSLQEDQPRLTQSAFIRYNRKGEVQATRFASAVIRSRRRLTYDQAMRILNGQKEDAPADVVEAVRQAGKLARVLQDRRREAGMLELELPDVELVLDDDDRVIDAQPESTDFSHKMIEMFMVEANEAVARLFHREGVCCLRRIHEPPADDALAKMSRFVHVCGHRIPAAPQREDLQRLLTSVAGKPDAFAVNLAVLRSLTRAEYSPRLKGHYALASECYCHFTSPIRRYPDLIVHRILGAYLRSGLEAFRQAGRTHEDDLAKIGAECTFAEQRAQDAERELKMVKVLQFLAGKVGEPMETVISGVTSFGMFCQCRRFLIEGLIRFDEMPRERWQIDEQTGTAHARRSGRKYRIGDSLRVVILSVDLSRRQLRLALGDE